MKLNMTKVIDLLILLMTLTLVSACNGIGTAEFKEVSNGTGADQSEEESGDGTDASINFAGIDSISDKTDSTVKLHWTVHNDASAYDVFNVASGSSIFVTSALDGNSNNVVLSNLTPNTLYKFRVRVRSSIGQNDSNTNDIELTMNLAPNTPTAMSLVDGLARNNSPTTIVRVDGVKSVDKVFIYTDANCDPASLVSNAAGVSANANETFVEITTTLPSIDDYDLYSQAENSLGHKSDCSSATNVTVAYEYVLCPIDGSWVAVPGDVTFDTDDFCVMKYEAKAQQMTVGVAGAINADGCGEAACTTSNWVNSIGGGFYNPATDTTGQKAVSVAEGKPWRQISQNDARTACSNLGSNYALINNDEWMTIAHNIYNRGSNWSNGSVGNGSLYRGHSDTSPASTPCDGLVENVVTNCATLDTNAANSNQKRTHTLSNNEVIWDMSGNVFDWIDWNIPCTAANDNDCKKAYLDATTPGYADGEPKSLWRQWNFFDATYGRRIDATSPMDPINWQSPDPTAGSAQGIGAYYAGSPSSGGAALRGERYGNGASIAGVFALNLSAISSGSAAGYGFRCVYRP